MDVNLRQFNPTAPAVWKMNTSSVNFDFSDPKTWWQFFFSIFKDIYANLFFDLLVKFWVVLTAGAITPPVTPAQFLIPSMTDRVKWLIKELINLWQIEKISNIEV